jgi:hypothetical protein
VVGAGVVVGTDAAGAGSAVMTAIDVGAEAPLETLSEALLEVASSFAPLHPKAAMGGTRIARRTARHDMTTRDFTGSAYLRAGPAILRT